MKDIYGSFITINEYNKFFGHVTKMLLCHFDKEEYYDCVFVLGSYIKYPYSYFKSQYPNKKIIIYQLEPLFYPSSSTWHSSSTIIDNIKEAEHVWDMDDMNSVFLSWYGIKVEKIVPMMYTRSIKNIPKRECDIDVLFYGFINQRRFDIIRKIQQDFYNNISFVWLYGIDYDKLPEYISRSKIILNIHSCEPYNRQEQVRIFYPLINEKCIVSETSQINYFGDAIIEAETLNISQAIKKILHNNTWDIIGINGEKVFSENRCKKINNTKT